MSKPVMKVDKMGSTYWITLELRRPPVWRIFARRRWVRECWRAERERQAERLRELAGFYQPEPLSFPVALERPRFVDADPPEGSPESRAYRWVLDERTGMYWQMPTAIGLGSVRMRDLVDPAKNAAAAARYLREGPGKPWRTYGQWKGSGYEGSDGERAPRTWDGAPDGEAAGEGAAVDPRRGEEQGGQGVDS